MQENIIIGIDSRPADNGADQVIRKLVDIKGHADRTGTSIDKMAGKGSRMGAMAGGANAAGAAINRMGGAAANTDKQLQYLERDLERTRRASAGLGGAVGGLGGEFSKVTGIVRGFAGVLAGLGIIAAGRYFLQTTDTLKRMEGQLRLSLAATQSFNSAFGDVQRIAATTRTSLEATTELYGRIAKQAGGLGITTAEVARATETYAKTLQISGATADEAAGALRQFSQAMARGELKGDEFVSMLENNSRMTRLLSDSLNVTQGALLKMAADGELSAAKLMKSLTDRKFTEAIDNEFKELPVTFSQAMQLIENSASVTIGKFDQGGQFSQMFVNFVLGGVKGFDDMGASAEDFGIRARATFEALDATLFDPLMEAARSFFDYIDERSGNSAGGVDRYGRRKGMQSLLGSVDDSTGWLASEMNDGSQSITPWLGLTARGSDFAPRYGATEDAATARLRTDKRDRDFRGNLLAGWDLSKPGALQRYVATGSGMVAPRLNTPIEDDEKKGRKVANPWKSREEAIQALGRDLKADGAKVDGNYAFGYTGGHANNAAHNRYKIDVNRVAGDDAANPLARAQNNRDALQAQKAGFRVLWNGEVYDPGGDGPTGKISGKNKHTSHMDIEAPKSIVGKARTGVRDAAAVATDEVRDIQRIVDLENKRNEGIADYWATLQNAVTEAGKLPNEAEQYNEELKLSLLYADGNVAKMKELSDADKKLIASRLEAKRIAEFETVTRKAGVDLSHENIRLERERAIIGKGTQKEQDKAMELERAMWPYRLAALSKGLNLEDAAVKKAMEKLALEQGITLEKMRQNAAIERANAAVNGALDRADPRRAIKRDYEQSLADVEISNLSPEEKARASKQFRKEYEQANSDVAMHFHDKMISRIDDIAAAFGGKFGALVGGVAKVAAMFKTMADKDYQDGSIGAQSDSKIARGLAAAMGLSKQFGASSKVQEMFGQASDGAAVGQQVATVAKALGLKNFSNTGAQIGGGIGKVAGTAIGGPVGGAIGSVIGSVGGGLIGGHLKTHNFNWGAAALGLPFGLVGGLIAGTVFAKSKKGSATLSGVNGGINIGAPIGNSDKAMAGATGLAGSVSAGLERLAQVLGVQIGNFSVSIGTRKGEYRVDPFGMGSTKKKYGAVNFGDDAEGAIRFAITEAIRDGALKGLSAPSTRVLQGTKDVDKVLNAVVAFEAMGRTLAGIKDPVKGAFDEFELGMKRARDSMLQAGYTAQELGQFEEGVILQRKALMKELTAPFRDMIEGITNGPNSGKSIAGQYEDAKSKFAEFEATLAGGGRVDSEEFTRIGSMLFDLSRAMFGSTTENFGIDRQRLVDASNRAIDNVDALSPEAQLLEAVNTAGAATVTELQGVNNRLDVIIENGLQSLPANETREAVGGNDNFIGGGGVSGGARREVNQNVRNL